MDEATKNKIENPNFIGGYVMIKVALNEGMIDIPSARKLCSALCKTHDLSDSIDFAAADNEKVNDYANLFVAKNARSTS
ncbi:Hypothetical protein POVR1_LOCUS294 [uncultured virus]|nr:Hypothetical protein POVR1_LOCUS294 [uncultured virus]